MLSRSAAAAVENILAVLLHAPAVIAGTDQAYSTHACLLSADAGGVLPGEPDRRPRMFSERARSVDDVDGEAPRASCL